MIHLKGFIETSEGIRFDFSFFCWIKVKIPLHQYRLPFQKYCPQPLKKEKAQGWRLVLARLFLALMVENVLDIWRGSQREQLLLQFLCWHRYSLRSPQTDSIDPNIITGKFQRSHFCKGNLSCLRRTISCRTKIAKDAVSIDWTRNDNTATVCFHKGNGRFDGNKGTA